MPEKGARSNAPVAGWEAICADPHFWNFQFNSPIPRVLVHGRVLKYFAYFWSALASNKNHALNAADRE